ncbi:MAG: ABC transporter permease [Gemmatimonadales bacterium]|nr:ABC transporter permease [Gemmatimonadales bacterium]
MLRYLLRSAPGHFHRSRSLFVLTVLGVALGVGAVLSIQIINGNALAAFKGSMRAVSGEVDLVVLGRVPVFAESLYVETVATAGVERAWAMYRADVAVPDRGGLYLQVYGIDLFQPIGLPIEPDAGDASDALVEPGWTAVMPELAEALGLAIGDSLVVAAGSRVAALRIGAIVDFRRLAPLASTKIVVMDLAQAQHFFGDRGFINQIDVRLTPAADSRDVAARLTAALGPTVDVLTPEQREQRAEGLLAAFRLNLTALSLISLFVGLFLVFASTQASLVRRRTEFGVLRALGATRRQILGLMLAETVVLGTLGVALGLALGYWVAATNVDAVSATLTNIYLLTEIERVELPPRMFALAAAIGIGGALAGSLGPALDMAKREPKSLLSAFVLHERLRSASVPLALLGAAIVGGSGLWYAIAGRQWQPAGFLLAISLLLGFPLLTPLTIRLATGSVRARDFGWSYSLRGLAVRMRATAIAVAALAVAVSMLTGITVMVSSFRQTLTVWVEATLLADVYVTSKSWARSTGPAPLDTTFLREVRRMPGIAGIDLVRTFTAQLGGRRVALGGVDFGSGFPETRYPFLETDGPDPIGRVYRDGAVIVSEPFARREHRWSGDSLALTGNRSTASLPIAGVYYDYASEGGYVTMDLTTMDRIFGGGPLTTVAIYLTAGTDAEGTVDAVRTLVTGQPLDVRSNRGLKEEVYLLFEETFAITRILQAMGLLIAACGITLTLLVIARERVSELALYRALGAVREQIFMLFLGKGLSMAVLSLVLGVFGGSLLALILIYVINRAYFGWTIQAFWPWGTLAWQAAAIVAVAAVASIYPAVRAARTPAAELSREDL